MYTPSTRRDLTVSSRRRRRCVLGFTELMSVCVCDDTSKDIPQRRVKRWSFNVRELLKDAAGREHFRRFLEKEFSAENLKSVTLVLVVVVAVVVVLVAGPSRATAGPRETTIAGPYHNLILYAPRSRRFRHREGRKRGEGCPLTI